MAVFPDKIVLKSSSDSDLDIRSAIQAGGADAIQQGEIVLGLGPDRASLYTLDSVGNVVVIISGGSSAISGVSSVNRKHNDVLLNASDLEDVAYRGDDLYDQVISFVPVTVRTIRANGDLRSKPKAAQSY